ncbi:MAG: PDZ domain-containing protein, partial [Victivallaceae bacterium]|nr:PDZ domain-containing protein [Victivallaceae bacterium]
MRPDQFVFLFRSILAVVLFSALPVFAAAPTEAQQLGIITKLTGRLIPENHYRRQALDKQSSSAIFDMYFKMLDPNKIYFTQKDIEAFEPQRAKLDEQMRDGNVTFAFEVYERFRKRVDEYYAYAEKLLNSKKLDFTVEESFVPDRRKEARAKDEAELHELWRKRLKNDVLYFRLTRRALDEEMKKSSGKEKTEKKLETASSAAAKTRKDDDLAAVRKLWQKRTPEEKVLTRLRDFANDIRQKEKIDVLGIFLTAFAQTYGPHSDYLAPKMDDDFEISMKLSLSGIGATLTSDDGYIKVVDLVPGGPADKEGHLKVEDRIIAVAQENGDPVDVIDMPVSKAVQLIRGAAGSRVTLTVL